MARKKDWSPRGPAWGEFIGEIIDTMRHSGESEAGAIAEVLGDSYNEGDLTREMALSILAQFEDWAKQTREEIEKHPA
jgi:hypothetical protein